VLDGDPAHPVCTQFNLPVIYTVISIIKPINQTQRHINTIMRKEGI